MDRDLTRARLATVPDGDYTFADYLDDDGAGAPVRLTVTLRVRGEEIELDYAGSDPQIHAAYNLPAFGPRHPFLAQAIINFVLSEEPDMPLTGAITRPLRCTAPTGSVVNPDYPAAVGVRYATVARAYDVVMGALAQAIPDRVPAAGSGAAAVVMVSVPDLESGGRQVAALEPLQGGGGATAGADGVDGTDAMAGFLRNTPVESVEANLPVLIERYELIPDSAGAGRQRGGWGTRLNFLSSPRHGRDSPRNGALSLRALGVACCRAAGRWTALTNPGTSREAAIGQIDVLRCDPGDVVSVLACGGGGYGDPMMRDAQAVLADCRAGLLSSQAALAVYGVVVDEAELDETATSQVRLRRGAARCDARCSRSDQPAWR